MIIDGGSCENVVSTYMVRNLGMKIEGHPEPYQLTWLKKGNTIKVSKRCLVQFSIGKNYKDEAYTEQRSGISSDWMRLGDDGRQLSKFEMDCTSGCSLEQHLSHLRQIFSVLRAQKLYANGKKCHFLVTEVTFLGYIVTGSGIKMDPTKVEAIISWPTPSTIHDIRSFHGLASFYRRFIRNFSSIIAPLTECMKGGRFTWTSEAAKAFDILKAKVTEAPVLALPNFDEVFQVECDASGVGIGGVLSQNQRPIAFFSEKLNDLRRKYSNYDKEFYAIVRSLDTWRHYLLSNEFFLFFDHEALKFINGQHKAQSLACLVADALSRRHSLITTMQIRVQGFDSFRRLYCDDLDFREICVNVIMSLFSSFPSWMVILFKEGHAGGLAGHFGRDKTLALLREQFYWPKMERDVNRFLKRCRMNPLCHLCMDTIHQIYSYGFGLVIEVGLFSEEGMDQINDNAYKIELPGHYNVSATFNVADLSPYKGDSDDEPDSGSSLFQEGEDDAGAVNERVNMTNMLGAYFAATNFCGRNGSQLGLVIWTPPKAGRAGRYDMKLRLVVNEMTTVEVEQREAFIELKMREVECREREIAATEYRAQQEDMKLYLQPYDHFTREQRLAWDEIRAKIKAKYNLQFWFTFMF
ncbi:RNA-directed DNA polymerase [Tanacetum coccineum]|uniref:RNA-directed DNA polymerase n=1 Tax=Tanacetum coccineum TaxID=301880 RepID=A0ABQ4Y063_9ASTR